MKAPTLERLRRRHEADKDRTVLVATAGRYTVSPDEDLYFRCLYAAIKRGYIKPAHG